MMNIPFLILLFLAGSIHSLVAQESVNYIESKVPSYALPELLVDQQGRKVSTSNEWEERIRPRLLALFSSQMYGRTPQEKITVHYQTLSENPHDLQGKATSKQVKFSFSNGKKTVVAILLMYIPNHVLGKVPVFIGYNYKGNQSTRKDSSILYSPSLPLVKDLGHPDLVRGVQASRWSYDEIIERGYAIATMCYHDVFPDKPGMKQASIVSLFSDFEPNSTRADEWQAIGAWAWGSSRIVDYLETQDRIDPDKIAIMGHSRQGKAALWAGAQDIRIKIVISNDSGSGGAALSRREFGETIDRVSTIKPAWFAPAFREYAGNVSSLPVDQHQLIALMAPRAVYVASAKEDLWADPKGEFLSAYYAGPVYELYGLKGLGTPIPPPVHQPILQDIGYHIREGGHDVTPYDWSAFLDFADLHFNSKSN